MKNLSIVYGCYIQLRLVRATDASYIHNLRVSWRYGRYLSAPASSVPAQEDWIEEYKRRETLGLEYYFVIERRDDGTSCGTIRLYNISDDSATWGSWILDENKPAKAALDSVLAIYDIAFRILGCKLAFVDVRTENEKSLSFQRRFGATEIGADSLNTYFKMSSDDFFNREPELLTVLEMSKGLG